VKFEGVICNGVGRFCREILWKTTTENVDRNTLKKRRGYDEYFRIEVEGGEDRE
jgi:hypothetical protein